jgi:membrane protein
VASAATPRARRGTVRAVHRAARLLDRVLLTTARAVLEFVDDRGHRDAAQISFFAVLSAIPLAMLLVGTFGLVFDEADVRERVITTAFDSVPLVQEGERDRLERAVSDALDNVGRIGPVSVLLLLVAATGVMGALRHSINVAWDIEARPPLLRRKALDLALVTGATVLLLASLSLTATRGAADLVGDEGGGGAVLGFLLDALSEVLPFAFVAAVVLFLYRVLPVERHRVREIWPGALVAAAGLFAVKNGLELYLEHLADFGALYGSLGALMALLLFVFAASNVLVLGAEFASEWARLPPDAEVHARVADGRRRVRALVRRR